MASSRPCPTCSAPMPMNRQGGFTKYCGIDCRPRCSIPDCGKPQVGLSEWCGAHKIRAQRYGDPLEPLRKGTNSGTCTVDGCEQPMRKRGWCASHYAQQYRTGKPPEPFKYRWAEPAPCKNCGADEQAANHREFCSDNCRAAYDLHGGPRPTATRCVCCGIEVSLLERGKRGQLRHSNVKFCDPCRQDYDKYKMTTRELANRDGLACGICGELVDLDLRLTGDLMRPSVDHIIPRARGGTHDPSNLQLAHLLCNMNKSDRVSPGA